MENTYELIEFPTLQLIRKLQDKTADTNVYAEWLLLFGEYNEANPKRRKGMACFPCYRVVYEWYLKQLEDETKN